MKKSYKILIRATLVGAICLFGLIASADSHAKKKTYTITPKSKILKPYTNSSNVNANTRHYLLIRSYMEKIEKNGGGKLILKKGTYKISNSVCIPSNTTLELKSGVKLIKHNSTGNAAYKPAQAMFHVVPPSVFNKKKKLSGYNGSHDVMIQGKGTVKVDLKNIKDAKGFVIAHGKRVTVKNIRFANMNSGHFLEIDATLDSIVDGCRFSGASASSATNKEAINLDTPDKLTGGLNVFWSSMDKTPNQNLQIRNCTFSNLNRGVGTHKYSQKEVDGEMVNCYHCNTILYNNTFNSIADTAIFMMNWKDTNVQENTFKNCTYGMDFRGVKSELNLYGNVLINTPIAHGFGKNNHIQRNEYYNEGASRNVYTPIVNDFGYEFVSELEDANRQ